MKVCITYVDGHEPSENQASLSLESFLDSGWNAELNKGITPATLNKSDFPFKDMAGGRLQSFIFNEPRKYPIKVSCLYNNLHFAKRVLDANESMVFAEHDVICNTEYKPFQFEDFCFLAMDHAFKPPTCLAKYNWTPPSGSGVREFPSNYPLQYYRETTYKGYNMTPGTAAYALSPSGARKVLDAAEKYGLEQSDFIYNSHNLKLEYISPSPVKYNTVNLNLSHKL